MENEELISLLWAITECVEIDSYDIEDIANFLEHDGEYVVDLINQIRDLYYEQKELELNHREDDIFEDFN